MREEAEKQMNIHLLQGGKLVTASCKSCVWSGIVVRLITRRDIQPCSEGHVTLKLHIISQLLQSTIN